MALTTQETSKPATQCMFSEMEKCGALWSLLATGLGRLNADGAFLCVNPALEVLLGASNRVVAGEAFARFFPQVPPLERLLSGHARAEISTTLVVTPGVEHKVRLSVQRTEEDGYFLEVTALDETIRTERESAVAEASAASRELLRNLAHEIKNPLGGIRGAAQLLEASVVDEDDRECAAVIREEADRLQALVDRFLAPYRRKEEKTACNVAALLEHVRSLMELEFPQLTVRRDYDVSAPDIEGDKGRLTQVFLNIARNAAQAMKNDPQGVLTLRTRIVRDILLAQRRVRRALCVSIEDTGPGIPPELRERIFYPLVTGRPEGSGLGLSIADAFVREAGGTIELESEPGRTVFRVLLPFDTKKGDAR